MENSRLLLLLTSLSQAEFYRFVVYAEARSTQVTRRELTLGLLSVLKKIYPNFWDPKILKKEKRKEVISKDRVFDLLKAKLSLNEELTNKTKNNIMSFLVQVIENFIIVEELKENTIERNIILAQALKKKNSAKLFEKTVNTALTKVKRLGNTNSVDYNLNTWRILHMQYFDPFHSKVSKDASVLLQNLINQLNSTWLITGNMYNIEAQNRRLLFDEEYNTLDLFKLEALFSYDFIGRNHHLTKGYKLLNELFRSDDERLIEDILEWYDLTGEAIEMTKSQNQSEKYEFLMVHSLLVNYYGIHILRGKVDYVTVLFELYKKALQNGYLIQNSGINQHHFITIVNLGLSLNEEKWIKDFIEKYKSHLSEKIVSSTLKYTELMLSFLKQTKEDYLDIYYKITQERSLDTYFDILYRVLEIKTLYRLLKLDEKFDAPLLARLGNFSDFLNNQRVINTENVTLTGNFNFVRIVKKMRLAYHHSPKDKLFLHEFIQKREFIAERAWLTKEIAWDAINTKNI